MQANFCFPYGFQARLQTAMKQKKKPARPPTDQPGEILYYSRLVGAYLRIVRTAAGFSLRDLEAMSGVSDSEIFKVESGAQDCRLESYVRICGALGITWGHALDNCLAGQFACYVDKIPGHAFFKGAEKIVDAEYPVDGFIELLAVNIAMCAAFMAHLIRCSRPSERARDQDYPSPYIKEKFCAFGDVMQKRMAPLDRLSFLKVIESDPLEALIAAKLMDHQILKDFIAAQSKKKSESMGGRLERDYGISTDAPTWTPFTPPEPDKFGP